VKAAPSAPGLSATYNPNRGVGGSAGPSYTLTVPPNNSVGLGYRGYAGINLPQVGYGLFDTSFIGSLEAVECVYYSHMPADPGLEFVMQDANSGYYHVPIAGAGGSSFLSSPPANGSSSFGTPTGDPNFPNRFSYFADPRNGYAPPWPENSSILRAAIVFFGTANCNAINVCASDDSYGSPAAGPTGIAIVDFNSHWYATHIRPNATVLLTPQPGTDSKFNFSVGNNNEP